MPVERNKYSKIGACSICMQGKQPMFNWAELLPPPPEHPPPSDLGSPPDLSGESSRQCPNNSGGITDTRFVDSRSLISPVSKISACSCPIPHDRVLPHLHVNIPYSDLEYPTHSGPPHRYHGDGSGTYPECGSGSCGGFGGGGGGNNYTSERPYSPKQGNSVRPQNSDSVLHRCQSPMSCHSCGSSVQQTLGPQLQQSSSSSYNPHHHLYHHQHHHHPLHTEASVSGQCGSNSGDLDKSKNRLYPQVGGSYPQGTIATSHTQTGNGQCPYSTVYPCPPTALHGYRIPPMELGNRCNSGDLDKFQGHVYQSGIDEHKGSHKRQPCQPSLTDDGNKNTQGDSRKR